MKIEVVQCGMCKHYDSEQYCEVWEQYITNDAFYCACGIKTDHTADTPQTCEDCENWSDTQDGCADRHGCYTPQTEKPKWTKENCKGCKYNEYPYDDSTCFVRVCIDGNKYEPKQTDCPWE